MKKRILSIFLCGAIILGIMGCGKKEKTENLQDTYNIISEYFGKEDTDRTNLGSLYLDEENNAIVVTLIDNSKEKQEEFIKNTNVSPKYIKFEQGGPYTTSGIDFYISKSEVPNDVKFNEYYKNNDRTIYIAANIGEFYVIDSGKKMTLKYYISNANQTFERSIQSLTEKLSFSHSYDDGGTSIYKSQEKDITMIVCNTIDKNKDVFIGNYLVDFDSESMCN